MKVDDLKKKHLALKIQKLSEFWTPIIIVILYAAFFVITAIV